MRLSHIARGALSAERARRLMELRGVTPNGHPLWTPPEVDPVVSIYPDYRSIFPLLTRRTKPAVYSKAGRLGVTQRRPLPWSDNEIIRLRKVYPAGSREEILTAFPGRTYAAVAKAANARGVHREKKPVVSTGNRLLDQVLVRAKLLGYTLAELDKISRSRSYFRRRRWRTKFDEVAHCRAAHALGGTLRVAFA